MIRVLHFTRIINRHDFIDTILSRLDRRRFEITALTAAQPARWEPHPPDEAYPITCLHAPIRRTHYPRLLAALMRTIRATRPHILHAHHYDEALLASIAVRLLGGPPLVIGHHYSDHIYYLSHGWRRRAHLAVEAYTNRAAARIVVPAQEVWQLLVERQGEPASRVEVIPYGLPFERYRASSADAPARVRHEHGLDGRFVVLACCRMNREKGLEYLLRAIPELRRRHPDLTLVLVGDGDASYKSELMALVRRLAIDDVVSFLGWRADALDWMAAADVIVQPSLCESYCQVLIEGLALGKPVVMTPVGAGPEVIGANERGRLVPRADADALAGALDELATDRTLGARLGAAGREYVEQNMRIDDIVARHAALYEDVAARDGGRRS